VSEAVIGEVRQHLVDFLVTNYLFGDVARTPADDESLIESGIVDSTGILELIEFLESDFSIEVTEAETVPQNLGSIEALVAFVTGKQAVGQGAGVR
jgi:acyl carrier protein